MTRRTVQISEAAYQALSFDGALRIVRETRRATDKLYRVRITEVGARRFEKEKSES